MSWFGKNTHLDSIMNQMQKELDERALSTPIQYAIAEREIVEDLFKSSQGCMPYNICDSIVSEQTKQFIADRKYKHKINAKKYGRI